jgi:hypothetical protein
VFSQIKNSFLDGCDVVAKKWSMLAFQRGYQLLWVHEFQITFNAKQNPLLRHL